MSVDLLKDLQHKFEDINFREIVSEDQRTLDLCESMYISYSNVRAKVEELLPAVEQLRGMCKGVQLASADISQYKEIFKQQCKDEKITKEEFWEKASIVDKCLETLKDTHSSRKDEFLKTIGRAEGFYQSALSLLEQIELAVNNYKKHKRMIEESPELFDEGEEEKGAEITELKISKPKRSTRKKKASKKG